MRGKRFIFFTSTPNKMHRVGDLSQKLSIFITQHLLPNACQVGGTLYSKPLHCTKEALKYQQDVWQIYQQIQSTVSARMHVCVSACKLHVLSFNYFSLQNNKHGVKLRDILLLLKVCPCCSIADSIVTSFFLLPRGMD